MTRPCARDAAHTEAICTQKLHILLLVLVCILLLAPDVGAPQLVHLHAWGHARPSGARRAAAARSESSARWAQRARNLRMTCMALVAHGTTSRKMATTKMLMTPSLTGIPNSLSASAPGTREMARHAARAPGAPAAAWLNCLFVRFDRTRVAQPQNSQPGLRRRSAAGAAACAPPVSIDIVNIYFAGAGHACCVLFAQISLHSDRNTHRTRGRLPASAGASRSPPAVARSLHAVTRSLPADLKERLVIADCRAFSDSRHASRAEAAVARLQSNNARQPCVRGLWERRFRLLDDKILKDTNP